MVLNLRIGAGDDFGDQVLGSTLYSLGGIRGALNPNLPSPVARLILLLFLNYLVLIGEWSIEYRSVAVYIHSPQQTGSVKACPDNPAHFNGRLNGVPCWFGTRCCMGVYILSRFTPALPGEQLTNPKC